MPTKGVIVAPTDDVASVIAPCTARVANRPIVCHALDALLSAGITELVVVAPPRALADIRACVDDDRGPGHTLRYVAQRSRPDLLGSLEAAASVVGDDPAVVHFADGLVGETLDGLSPCLGEGPDGLLLLVHRAPDKHAGLGPVTETPSRRNRVEWRPQPSRGSRSLRVWTTSSPPCSFCIRGF